MGIVLYKAEPTGGFVEPVQTHDQPLNLAAFCKQLMDLFLSCVEGSFEMSASARDSADKHHLQIAHVEGGSIFQWVFSYVLWRLLPPVLIVSVVLALPVLTRNHPSVVRCLASHQTGLYNIPCYDNKHLAYLACQQCFVLFPACLSFYRAERQAAGLSVRLWFRDALAPSWARQLRNMILSRATNNFNLPTHKQSTFCFSQMDS